jgi:hypothetical protein
MRRRRESPPTLPASKRHDGHAFLGRDGSRVPARFRAPSAAHTRDRKPLFSLIEWTLAFRELNDVRARTASLNPAEPFAERALRSLRVSIDVEAASLERIPSAGPLVVVANHPFGALDGLALLALLKRRRPDVKVLANHLLAHVPEMRDDCLFVDPFGGCRSARRNVVSIRTALRWVRGGGSLAVFPSGEVSGLRLRRGDVADIGWSASVARLIRASGSNVLPIVSSPGRNSDAFQVRRPDFATTENIDAASRIAPQARDACQRTSGNVISASKLAQYGSDDGTRRISASSDVSVGTRENRVAAPLQATPTRASAR